jgi:hypothetical protein
MGDGEKSRRALDETILVKGSSTSEAGSIADGLAGTQLQHFALVRLLGRGGMGAVYYGTDLSLDRPVAIKVLALDVAQDPEIADRFVLEARAQARLRHPNVAQIFFIGQDRGFHFFVMEYLEGPGLDAFLAKGTPLPVADASGLHPGGGARSARGLGARLRPPRREALEPHARQRSGHQDPRLRLGQEHARRCPAHARRRHHRLAALHFARARARPGGRSPLGHLLARLHALPHAVRATALQWARRRSASSPCTSRIARPPCATSMRKCHRPWPASSSA